MKFQGSENYVATPDLMLAVNAAIDAASGRCWSRASPAPARRCWPRKWRSALGMPLLQWHIKSHHQGAAGPVRVRRGEPPARLQLGDERVKDIHNYIVKGVLWQAFTADEPVVLLIDEIDKADIEFPNDLLRELDRMEFYVYETRELVKATHRPLVFITSNNEKELPDAFLRRCFFHYIKFPDADTMKRDRRRALPGPEEGAAGGGAEELLRRAQPAGPEEEAVDLASCSTGSSCCVAEDIPLEALQSKDDKVAVPPLVGALLKNEQDVLAVREARLHAARTTADRAWRPCEPVTLESATASGSSRCAGARGRRCAPPPPTASSGTCASPRCPSPTRPRAYIEAALQGIAGRPHAAVRGARRRRAATIVGSTRYHDIVPAVERLEIGYTWYAQSARSARHVNTELQAAAADACVRDARLQRWSAGAPTTSTSRASARSSASARARTACCATTRCAATARCATP